MCIQLLPGVDTTEFSTSCQEDNFIIIPYGCYYLPVYLEYISLELIYRRLIIVISTIIVIHALDNSINYYVNFILYLCDVLSQIHCIIINKMRNEIMSVIYDRVI